MSSSELPAAELGFELPYSLLGGPARRLFGSGAGFGFGSADFGFGQRRQGLNQVGEIFLRDGVVESQLPARPVQLQSQGCAVPPDDATISGVNVDWFVILVSQQVAR